MFLILLKYTAGLDIVNEHVEAHRTYLDRYYAQGKFICSGAQIPRKGGVILCNSRSREEVQRIINQDPFHIHGAAEYEIIEFAPTKCAEAFEPFITGKI
jgi:uncharacterized protein YciI